MNPYVTGSVIRRLREKLGMSQKELAERLSVSDKAVSRWETGRGLPDVTLLEPLAQGLGVSVGELLAGEAVVNRNRSANMLKGSFYICPVCGNILFSTGEGAYSCCGILLPPMEAEEPDELHGFTVERSETEWYVSLEHPMTREHYIAFMAYVTSDRAEIVRMYPEQNAETRFFRRGLGYLYVCCSRDGLYRVRVR